MTPKTEKTANEKEKKDTRQFVITLIFFLVYFPARLFLRNQYDIKYYECDVAMISVLMVVLSGLILCRRKKD